MDGACGLDRYNEMYTVRALGEWSLRRPTSCRSSELAQSFRDTGSKHERLVETVQSLAQWLPLVILNLRVQLSEGKLGSSVNLTPYKEQYLRVCAL
jgi:hypothetical protein